MLGHFTDWKVTTSRSTCLQTNKRDCVISDREDDDYHTCTRTASGDELAILNKNNERSVVRITKHTLQRNFEVLLKWDFIRENNRGKILSPFTPNLSNLLNESPCIEDSSPRLWTCSLYVQESSGLFKGKRGYYIFQLRKSDLNVPCTSRIVYKEGVVRFPTPFPFLSIFGTEVYSWPTPCL